MQVFRGRPEESAGRADRELRTYDLLDRLGIGYDRADHDAAMTMEVCARIDEALGVRMCKNLFLRNRQGTQFYLLMMPGDKPFKTKELSGQLGVSRLSFAGEEDMARLLDLKPGSVSAMGLMNDREGRVRLLIDEDVARGEYIGCHPCENTSSIKIKTEDLMGRFLPAVGHRATFVKLGAGEEPERKGE